MRWGPMVVGAVLCAAGSARAQALPCREDDTLAETAASLLLRGTPVRGGELLGDARAHGFDGVVVHARDSEDDAAIASWLAGLSGEGTLVCGEARGEARRLMLASRRGGKLSREGERLRIALEPGFKAPSLVYETEQGELVRAPLSSADLAKGALIPSAPALRRVQLIAESSSGPRPVAELALSDGGALATPVVASEGGGTRMRSSDAVLGQLTSFRHQQGLGELRDNQLLSASAQRHASRLCELGRLAHKVEGEDPELRLKREHIAARHVGEVLARAESSDRAFQALLDSPSHRMALSRREFTDAGVGQASDRKGQVCMVLLLAAWPRRIP